MSLRIFAGVAVGPQMLNRIGDGVIHLLPMKLCCRCHENDRRPGQPYCQRCITAVTRESRARKRGTVIVRQELNSQPAPESSSSVLPG
jgi:hypothetical protein